MSALRGALLPLFLVLPMAVPAQPQIGTDVSPIGCQTVWPVSSSLNTFLDRAVEAGIDTVRSDAMWWGLVEYPATGEYHWDGSLYPGWGGWNVDNWVTQVTSRGLEPYVILGLGNAVYDPDPMNPADWISPLSETSRAAFAAYCFAAADRFRDDVDIWEIWNEPNLEMFWGGTPDAAAYTALVASAAAQVRAADPTATIVGGVTSGVDNGYLTTCFQSGLLDHVDVVAVHPYRTSAPETVGGDLATLRSLITTYAPPGKDIAIWTGEWGYNTYFSEVDETGHAKSLARMMVNNMAEGVELSIWFSIHAFQELDPSGTDSEWGLLNRDLTRRPSFYAMQAVNDRLPPPVAHIADPYAITFGTPLANRRAEVFERGDADHRTAALWLARWPVNSAFTPETSDVSFTVPSTFELRECDALDGSEIALDARWSGGQVTLTALDLHDYPIFVDVDPEVLPGGSNLALSAVGHSTSSDFNGASGGDKAYDGIVTEASKWTSNGSSPTSWLALDLGDNMIITGMALRLPSLANEWSVFNAEAVEFQTGPSLTGPWTTVASEVNSLQHDRIISVLASQETSRFVRLLVTDAGIDNFARIQEFEVYGLGAVAAELTGFAVQ